MSQANPFTYITTAMVILLVYIKKGVKQLQIFRMLQQGFLLQQTSQTIIPVLKTLLWLKAADFKDTTILYIFLLSQSIFLCMECA